jgi:hypothetical protein
MLFRPRGPENSSVAPGGQPAFRSRSADRDRLRENEFDVKPPDGRSLHVYVTDADDRDRTRGLLAPRYAEPRSRRPRESSIKTAGFRIKPSSCS